MDTTRGCRAVLLVWMMAFVPASLWADRCDDCHGDPGLYAADRKLYDYYQDWLTSPHRRAGVTCSECHGGDPDAEDKATAHAGRLPVIHPSSTVYAKRQPETCGRCHREVAEQFTGSRHCSKVLSDELAPTCTTCHRAMNRKPYSRDILRQSCEHCHNPRHGPGPSEVIDRAAEILHRLSISRYLLGWTASHFNREGWPGDSRRQVEGWRQAYHAALVRTHSLELLSVEDISAELLSALKQAFDEHRGWPPARPAGR